MLAKSNGSGEREARWVARMAGNGLHPAWGCFLRFCEQLRHGEIERLKIQDGLPVLAEVTKKKIKFGH